MSKPWNWTRCPFLHKKQLMDAYFNPTREYSACAANLLSEDSCTYPTIYGEFGVEECGTHKLIRLTKKRKKAMRTNSAYDGLV